MRGQLKPSKSACSCSPTTALLLSISACCVLVLLTIVTLPRASTHMEETSYAKRRSILYESMAKDLEEHGAKFLEGGSTSQSLALSDIFKIRDGNIEPILKPADPAVRAVVLYLDPKYANHISDVVRRNVVPFLPKGVWYQDSNLYHFSMFHASHHHDPVVATPSEVLSGTDPAVIRNELRKALPHAPVKQLYNEVMLHTSFARLLGPPANLNLEESSLSVFKKLVAQLNIDLHQYKAKVKEMWFVEELDVLALALKGHIKKHRFALQCEKE